jgi:CRISP-associated protein Cas1
LLRTARLEVNAMLSYGYTLLVHDGIAALETVGLDAAVGFMHQARWGGCRMSDRARQAFLAAYERRMLTIFTHESSGRRVSYRVGLGLQAKALGRAVLSPGQGNRYQPVRWK